MRVNINISEELLKQIDEKAKELYISRSAYISTVIAQKLQTDAMVKQMPEMTKALQQFDINELIKLQDSNK